MSSVEGFYKFEYGQDVRPDLIYLGGVVVLETGRIFGGDSSYYYRGSYKLDGEKFLAKVQIRKHTDLFNTENIFGREFNVGVDLSVEGEREGENLVGILKGPTGETTFTLERLDDLP